MRRRRLAAPAVMAGTLATMGAHIGSPDTWFAGRAGPYPVRILVRSPGVIPGLADVVVTVTGAPQVIVTASPAAYNADARGVPPADTARAVPGRPGSWTVPLWIMVPGSYGVRVSVSGPAGGGTVIVPVSAVATRVLAMKRGFGWLLAGLGTILLLGAVTLVGAAVRESVLPAGAVPDAGQRRRGRIAMAGAAGLLLALLAGGKAWWDAIDRDYRRGLDRSWTATAEVEAAPSGRMLHFLIADSAWRGRGWRERPSPLIPDHGKLMHLILVREPDAGVLAHLHPVSADSVSFLAPLPPLPAGPYRVFADLTHESGFSRTLVASVELPAPEPTATAASPDPDDTWFAGPPRDSVAPLAGGASLHWEGRPERLSTGDPAALQFVVRQRDGRVGVVEPYLGMAGHAMVMREDGKVFIHLHPMGTVSPASQAALLERRAADSVWGTLGRRLTAAAHGSHGPSLEGRLSFPYAFPDPGSYRLWVQLRRAGAVETAAFRVQVY